MRSVPVAVDRVSPPSEWACDFCHVKRGGELSTHWCQSCGIPQPLKGDEDPFSAFGLEPKFKIDTAQVQKRFYELSRNIHPDRFAKETDKQKIAIDRMSFINSAFETLKDEEKRREWLLRAAGFLASKKEAVPMGIAEAWFDLQDEFENASAEQKLELRSKFLEQLKVFDEDRRKKISELESRLDIERDPGLLKQLEELHLHGAYLRSLKRDVSRG